MDACDEKVADHFLIIISCYFLTGCTFVNFDNFKTAVNNLLDNYHKYEMSDDLLSKDIHMKVACGDLREMAIYYQEAKSRDVYNEYLEDQGVTNEIIQTIYEYNKEGNGTAYRMEEDLLDYFGENYE